MSWVELNFKLIKSGLTCKHTSLNSSSSSSSQKNKTQVQLNLEKGKFKLDSFFAHEFSSTSGSRAAWDVNSSFAQYSGLWGIRSQFNFNWCRDIFIISHQLEFFKRFVKLSNPTSDYSSSTRIYYSSSNLSYLRVDRKPFEWIAAPVTATNLGDLDTNLT